MDTGAEPRDVELPGGRKRREGRREGLAGGMEGERSKDTGRQTGKDFAGDKIRAESSESKQRRQRIRIRQREFGLLGKGDRHEEGKGDAPWVISWAEKWRGSRRSEGRGREERGLCGRRE